MTILKIFGNTCLQQQRKKYLKRGNINNSGTLDYLILRLEGKHKSSDGRRNLLPAVPLHIERHIF